MMIMTMGQDYASKLRPMGLLFIPYMIYEPGVPLWNGIDRWTLIRPPEFRGNFTNSYLVAKHDDMAKEMNFAYEISLSH
jgi:hypothetical protein